MAGADWATVVKMMMMMASVHWVIRVEDHDGGDMALMVFVVEVL